MGVEGWCWVVRQQWRASCHNERDLQPTPIPPLWAGQWPTSRVCPHNTSPGFHWLAAIAGFQHCQSKTLSAQRQTGRDFEGIIQSTLQRIIDDDSGVSQPFTSHPPLLWLPQQRLLWAGKSHWLLHWISSDCICVVSKKTVLGFLNWSTRAV